MTSCDDAFLILKKWRDDPGPPLIYLLHVVANRQTQGASIASGSSFRVLEVNSQTGLVELGGAFTDPVEIDLSDATFEYSDSRDSPLIDGKWVCSLEAALPDGELIVFAEYPPLPE